MTDPSIIEYSIRCEHRGSSGRCVEEAKASIVRTNDGTHPTDTALRSLERLVHGLADANGWKWRDVGGWHCENHIPEPG